MADIAADAKVFPDDSALVGASKLFSHLWNEAWSHAHATLEGDADALHDMRVNLRRLRTTIQNFEGPKTAPLLSAHLREELREHNKRVAKVGDLLGDVRDHDVLEHYIKEYAHKKLKVQLHEAPALQAFAHHLEKERAHSFKPMKKRLTKGQKYGELHEEFARWSLGLPAAQGAPIAMTTVAKLVCARRIGEIFEFSSALEPNHADEEHHELRKSLRRLRYSLETFSTCLHSSPKNTIKQLVDMQDLLGEMQDHAVLEMKTHLTFGSELPPEIIEFNLHGTRRKRYLLGRVRRLWDEAQNNNFWGETQELWDN